MQIYEQPNHFNIEGVWVPKESVVFQKRPTGKELINRSEIMKTWDRFRSKYIYESYDFDGTFDRLSEARDQYIEAHNKHHLNQFMIQLQKYNAAFDDPDKVCVTKVLNEDNEYIFALDFGRGNSVDFYSTIDFRRKVFENEEELFKGKEPVDYPGPMLLYK